MNAADMNATNADMNATREHGDQQRDVICDASASRGRWLFKGLPVRAGSLFFCPLIFRSLPMRALILVAALPSPSPPAATTTRPTTRQNVDENLTAENIVSNDVTAIDAVTGDAANMAADVDSSKRRQRASATAMPTTPAHARRRPAGQARPASATPRRAATEQRRPTRPNSSGQPDDLVRLQRQAPFRPLHRQPDRRLDRLLARPRSPSAGPGNGRKSQLSSSAGSIPVLRPHQLQLVARCAGRPRSPPWG